MSTGVYPDVWPGRCTVVGCTQIAGVAMTSDYGRKRWARCDQHLGFNDDGTRQNTGMERRG